MHKSGTKILIIKEKDNSVIHEVSVDWQRRPQAIKFFMEKAINDKWITKSNLLKFFMRRRIIPRGELLKIGFDADLGEGKEDDKKR